LSKLSENSILFLNQQKRHNEILYSRASFYIRHSCDYLFCFFFAIGSQSKNAHCDIDKINGGEREPFPDKPNLIRGGVIRISRPNESSPHYRPFWSPAELLEPVSNRSLGLEIFQAKG